MKDYQALNPNPSLPVGYVDSVDLISLKIYKLSILSHSKKKNTDVVKKAYRVYRAYSEAWILILRQISLQNLCRPRGKVYMNPTWRRRWQKRQSFGFLRFAFGRMRKKHRPRRRSLRLQQRVALARSTRELLPQPRLSVAKINI